MIPLILAVGIGTRRVAGIRPWIPIPLFLIWLFLLPFCLLLLPVYFIGCRQVGMRGWATLAAGWSLLAGLSGTYVDVNVPEVSLGLRFI